MLLKVSAVILPYDTARSEFCLLTIIQFKLLAMLLLGYETMMYGVTTCYTQSSTRRLEKTATQRTTA